jgi:hypothetical protein
VRQHEGEAEAEGGEHNERGRSDAFVGSLYFAIEGFGLGSLLGSLRAMFLKVLFSTRNFAAGTHNAAGTQIECRNARG